MSRFSPLEPRLRPNRLWLSRRSAYFTGFCWSLLALGCGGEDELAPPSDVSAELSDIATVVRVTWQTSEPSVGYVEYGPTEELGNVTPIEAEATTDHDVTLLGLTASSDYFYRAVTWADGRQSKSPIEQVQTGPLPGGLPQLTLTGSGHDAYTIVPTLGARPAILILDPDGRIVWYHLEDRALDFFRARLSVDGKSLLYNAGSVAGDPADETEIVRVALDGSTTNSIPIPLLAHDFVEHSDGTLAAIVVEYRDFEGAELRGEKIVEIAPDGEETTVFSVWDCFDPEQVTGDAIEQGWTFANALDFDPEQNAYYLGLRNFSSIVRIGRDTGSCDWVLGLYGSTFEFADGADRFLHQHQFDVTGNHVLILDNDGRTGGKSRVLEYELDFDEQLATQTWSYVSDPPIYTFALGEPSRLDDGDVFVNWSVAGQLERVSADGEARWTLSTGAGVAFGFHTLARSLYPVDARLP